MKETTITAIVLAAGQGSRMGNGPAKQYRLLGGKPVLYYSLAAFEACRDIAEIILVTREEEIPFCRREVADQYGLTKVTRIISGGKERYHSVCEGLKAAAGATHVLIHDGARPFLTQEMLARSISGAVEYEACVLGVPVKDTIKSADGSGFIRETLKREILWQIQTPQSFAYPLISEAYRKLFAEPSGLTITDDAMVVEHMTGHPVKIEMGSYENIKITTPDDMKAAECFLNDISIP